MTLKSINHQVPVLQQRKAGSNAVLQYMARIYPLTASRDELAHVFTQVDSCRTASVTLHKRISAALTNMVNSGFLSCEQGESRVYCFIQPVNPAKPAVQPKKTVKPEPLELEPEPEPEPEPAYVGVPAPAPNYDVLRCPVYQPPQWSINRAGAQNFRAAPSRGTRC